MRENINSKFSDTKYCHKCRVILTEENWKKCNKDCKEYICNTCNKLEWIEEKKTTLLVRRNGKYITLHGNRRPEPSDKKCEFCKVRFFRVYHHWDDTDISKGLYLCGVCHIGAEYIEHKSEEYLKLKNSIQFTK